MKGDNPCLKNIKGDNSTSPVTLNIWMQGDMKLFNKLEMKPQWSLGENCNCKFKKNTRNNLV